VRALLQVVALAASIVLLTAMAAAQPESSQYGASGGEPRIQSPAEIARLLQTLRNRREAEGWRFKVGSTGVLGRSFAQSAGGERALPSREWLERRRDFANAAVALYGETKRRLGIASANGVECVPTAKAFSWLEKGRVLPPRDQRILHQFPWCGSCWAFAPIAALESSYLIENGLAADAQRPPIKASEQLLLSCTPDSNCTLGYVSKALDLLVLRGTTSRSELPYGGIEDRADCKANFIEQYNLVAWGPVSLDAEQVPAPESIKETLCKYGPVTARIIITTAFAAYKGEGAFHQVDDVKPSDPSAHHLVIIGWDETKGRSGAWLVKNSWVDDWGLVGEGMGGYGWIEFGANLIGHHSNWVLAFQAGVSPAAMEPGFSQLKKMYLNSSSGER